MFGGSVFQLSGLALACLRLQLRLSASACQLPSSFKPQVSSFLLPPLCGLCALCGENLNSPQKVPRRVRNGFALGGCFLS